MIGIIALIAAISYPVFATLKRNGLSTKTITNMHNLQLATVMYQSDQGGQSSGTAEEMGLPPYFGFIHSFRGATQQYIQPWLKDMKSPFGSSEEKDYATFAYPSDMDHLPVPWSACTQAIGSNCVLYWDPYEPGHDSINGWWVSTVPYDIKRLHGVTLAGNLVTHQDIGNPDSEAWWLPPNTFSGSQQ